MYIWETLRTTDDRVKEHKRYVAKGEIRSYAVAEHVWTEDHKIEWNNTIMTDRAAGTFSRLVKESLHVVKEKTKINKDKGQKLRALRKSLFI